MEEFEVVAPEAVPVAAGDPDVANPEVSLFVSAALAVAVAET